MNRANSKKRGKVYLVGAGPGAPGMITLRGVECLSQADVVLYDYLVNPQILEHVRLDCESVCLGQHGRTRIWTQEEINQRLIDLASEGRTVVRLKGGDPAVFARGAEEAETLAQNGVDFEIVPGITVALAAGSCAGVPITHRDFASAVALITAQEKPGKSLQALDYQALANFPGTLVFYMGVTTAPQWTSALIEAGRSPTEPAAIIRRCSFADQQTVLCTLGEVATRLASPDKIRPPVIVIVGQVTTLASKLAWFDKRPLFGVKVMVTRPVGQAAPLSAPLRLLGADVLLQAAIEISAPADWSPVDDALGRLAQFDWLVFSSANGVRWLLERLEEIGQDMRALAGVKLAAIGPGTANQLREYHLVADLQPEQYRAESLAAALTGEAEGKRFLLARASRGREVLAEQLRSAGGEVEQIVVYSSTDVPQANKEVVQRIESGDVDWITVTSSAIARSLASMFGDHLRNCRLASISPITSDTLRKLGFEVAVEAQTYTMQGVVDAIADTV